MYKQLIKHKLGANVGVASMNSAEETVTRRSVLKHCCTNVPNALLRRVNDVSESRLRSLLHLTKDVDVGH